MSDELTMAASSVRAWPDDAGDRPAALLVVAGEILGTIFDLDMDEITVGRSADVDIPLEFPGISRRHCMLRSVDGRFEVSDCGSKNGTFVNDRRIEIAVGLDKGDLVRLGPVVLQYIPRNDPERLAYERLNHRAQIDRFTGCYNKSYFNERIELETRSCKAQAGELSLVVFDFDRFKALNDGYGHDAGDFVLEQVAGLVQTYGVRKQDIFARYGGEEFAILLPGTGLDACIDVAERLRRLVAGHAFDYDGRRLPVTISIGVAACDAGVATGAELFRRADAAMYDAKRGGRNRVCVRRG